MLEKQLCRACRLVDNIMILIINIFAALATGGAVVAGQYLGQQKKEQACKSVAQLIWTITIFSLVITVAVYMGKYWILHKLFGQIEADVMHHADVYLLIVTASIPFIALYNGGAAVFRAMGNSEVSMRVSLLMNAINVSGNAILIYGFHCGTEGVAIPTLVSRFVAAFIIIKLLLKDKWSLHLERTFRFNPDWSMIRKILSVGIPNGLENSMFQLGKVTGTQSGIDFWNICNCCKCSQQYDFAILNLAGNGNLSGGDNCNLQMCRSR